MQKRYSTLIMICGFGVRAYASDITWKGSVKVTESVEVKTLQIEAGADVTVFPGAVVKITERFIANGTSEKPIVVRRGDFLVKGPGDLFVSLAHFQQVRGAVSIEAQKIATIDLSACRLQALQFTGLSVAQAKLKVYESQIERLSGQENPFVPVERSQIENNRIKELSFSAQGGSFMLRRNAIQFIALHGWCDSCLVELNNIQSALLFTPVSGSGAAAVLRRNSFASTDSRPALVVAPGKVAKNAAVIDATESHWRQPTGPSVYEVHDGEDSPGLMRIDTTKPLANAPEGTGPTWLAK